MPPLTPTLNVTSLPNTNGDYVTLTCPDGTELTNVAATGNPSPGDTPADAQFPAGFLSFKVRGVTKGGAVAVQIILHNPPADGINSYWKYGPAPDNAAPHWYEFLYDGATGAEISGNTITLHFVDGGRGDADLTTDGVITDPGAPAVYNGGSGQNIPVVPQCGGGACGAGAVGYVPVICLGLCGLKLRQRRRPA